MRPHRDLPAGSQGWAADVDRMEQRIKDLEALVTRLSTMLRVDPTRPDLNVNPQTIAPAVNSADKQKLSGLADTSTYNVADQQSLVWDQKQQAWVPKTLDFVRFWPVDDVFVEDGSKGVGIGEGETFASNGPESFIAFRPDGWVLIKARTGDTAGGTGGFERLNMFGGRIDLMARDSTGNDVGIAINYVSGGVQIAASHVLLPVCTSATRPSFGGGYGACVFDQTLGKPIFSNGTAWVDATGTAV